METIQSVQLDANESIFFARELESIKARSYDKKYPMLKAKLLIPVSSEAGSGAESITYQSYNEVGVAKIIANYADDLPRADVVGEEFTSPVRTIGGAYGYSLQAIRAAQMANKPLTQRKANACRRANEQLTNTLAWNGDSASKLEGLLYYPNVTKAKVQVGVTTSTYPWSTKNPTEIVRDMMDAVDDVVALTNGMEIPNMLIMPLSNWSKISGTRMETGTDTTIKQFFMTNRPGVGLDWVNELKDVNPVPSTGAASDTDVLVSYVKNPDNLTLEIPQAYEQLPVQERGLEFIINTQSRFGGVIIYYPLSVSIIEDV